MIQSLIADPLGGLIRILYMLPGLIMGFTLHEWAHSFAALKAGDDSQKQSGRLSLNPLRHIDWVGLALFLIFGFGWAKPVQTNRLLYDNRKRGDIMVGFAGVCGNLALCVVSALIYTLIPAGNTALDIISNVFYYSLSVNATLFALNLLPIPPLDGSKILRAFFPGSISVWTKLDQYGFVLLLALSLFGILGFVTGIVSTLITRLCLAMWSFI